MSNLIPTSRRENFFVPPRGIRIDGYFSPRPCVAGYDRLD